MNRILLRPNSIKNQIPFLILILLVGGMISSSAIVVFQLDPDISNIMIISPIVLILSLWIMNKSVNIFDLKYLTIPGFFFWAYLAMIFIPSFYIYVEHPGPYRDTYLLAVTSVLLTIPIGIIFAKQMLKFKNQEIRNFFRQATTKESDTGAYKIVFFMLLAISIIMMFVYLHEVEIIPLLYMIKNPGEYEYSLELREFSGKLLMTTFTYIYEWVKFPIFPFLIVISWGIYLHNRLKKWFMLSLMTLIVGIIYCALVLVKGHVALIFLVLFVFYYISRSGKVSIKGVIVFFSAILSFPLFVFFIITYGMGVNIFSLLLERIFYVTSDVLYYYFEIFPNDVGYLFGRSIRNIARVIGEEHFDTANYVFRYIWPKSIESGHANAAFVGNLHADFGLIGVLFGGVFAGFIMQWININLVRMRKTVLSTALYSVLIVAFLNLCFTALPVVLLTHGVVLIFIIWILVKTVERVPSSRFKDNQL